MVQKLTQKALQDNIRRHPGDTPNIFKALARLGRLCSGLAEDVTPRLLVHRNRCRLRHC
jgi:hypothetical protein